MIKADLKHWGGRRGVNGPYEIDYGRFVGQASRVLGKGGVVGIPNARGPDHPLGPEYRFEELANLAGKSKNQIEYLGDGSVFYDKTKEIYFVKSQEINLDFSTTLSLTYLVFGYPLKFNTNLNEQNPDNLRDFDLIKILTAPNCLAGFSSSIETDGDLIRFFHGVVVHSSSATVLGESNKKASNLYKKQVAGKEFEESKGYLPSHTIGAIAVSGGHRSPKESLIQRIVSPISIGSSYTSFTKFEGKTLEEFYGWLRNSIENSNTNNLVKGSIKREMMFRHLPRMIQGVLDRERKSIF